MTSLRATLLLSLPLAAAPAAASAPPGDCAPPEDLATAVAAVFGAGTDPATLTLPDLLAVDGDDLERLFTAAPAPAFAAVLGTDAPRIVLTPGPSFGLPDGTLAFRPEALTPAEACAGGWFGGAAGDLPFKAYAATSFFDDCPVLRLVYDVAPNGVVLRRSKDEVRALNPQLCLGVALDASTVDDDGLPLDGPAGLQRFFAIDLATPGSWQDVPALGWPWSGVAPAGGPPPVGWTPDFAVDPIQWPFGHKVVALRHGDLHYADERPSGTERGTVLFVHGNPTWGFLWRGAMVELLQDGWRVVAPDHFGFGLSDKLPWGTAFPYAPADHADVLEDFVHALDLTDVTLVVHDWGTATGLSLAGHLPSRVARILVLNGWAWNVDPVTPGPFHKMVAWSQGNASDPSAFLDTGIMAFNVGLGLAAQNGLPGSDEYQAVLEAYWGPFLDVGTGLPLSTEAILPTWIYAVEILEDRDFLTATERGLAAVRDRPFATRFGILDQYYGQLQCDEAPQPECPVGLTCVEVDGRDLCVDGTGEPAMPVLERFEEQWQADALAGRRSHYTGHFVVEKRGPEIAADVRYLAHFAGSGCGQGGEWPRLSSTPMLLGQTVTLTLEGAEPVVAAALFGSLVPPAGLPLSADCTWWLDFATLFFGGFFIADFDGFATLSGPAPSNPALVGTALRFQAFPASASGALGGFDATNGVEVVLE